MGNCLDGVTHIALVGAVGIGLRLIGWLGGIWIGGIWLEEARCPRNPTLDERPCAPSCCLMMSALAHSPASIPRSAAIFCSV